MPVSNAGTIGEASGTCALDRLRTEWYSVAFLETIAVPDPREPASREEGPAANARQQLLEPRLRLLAGSPCWTNASSSCSSCFLDASVTTSWLLPLLPRSLSMSVRPAFALDCHPSFAAWLAHPLAPLLAVIVGAGPTCAFRSLHTVSSELLTRSLCPQWSRCRQAPPPACACRVVVPSLLSMRTSLT